MEDLVFRGRDFIFLDLEFSSLRPDAEIIEIGGLLVNHKNFKIEEEFDYKIKMLHPEKADPQSLNLVGYNEDLWKDAILIDEALNELYKIFEGKIMVGFNLAMDFARLEKAFYEAKILSNNKIADPFYKRKIDVLSIAYFVLKDNPEIKYFSLRELCNYFKIPIPKEHCALEDARATYFLFLKLLGYN